MYLAAVGISWGIQCSGNDSALYYSGEYRFHEIAWFGTKRTFGRLADNCVCRDTFYKIKKKQFGGMKVFFRKKENLSGVEYIVVGLGNPDRKYENTRHNAGFITVDMLAEKIGIRLDRIKYKSLCNTGVISDKKVLLMKPSTYMNLSGQAVVEAMNFFKVPPEKVIVIFDDISLDVGKMRIRRKGSDGGHNGIKNIIYLSGSDMFPRIKVGVGHKPEKWDLADWVLSEFTDSEKKLLSQTAENACNAVELIISENIEKAMNSFNS